MFQPTHVHDESARPESSMNPRVGRRPPCRVGARREEPVGDTAVVRDVLLDEVDGILDGRLVLLEVPVGDARWRAQRRWRHPNRRRGSARNCARDPPWRWRRRRRRRRQGRARHAGHRLGRGARCRGEDVRARFFGCCAHVSPSTASSSSPPAPAVVHEIDGPPAVHPPGQAVPRPVTAGGAASKARLRRRGAHRPESSLARRHRRLGGPPPLGRRPRRPHPHHSRIAAPHGLNVGRTENGKPTAGGRRATA